MDEEQALQGVLRQRRNFLLVSGLLAAFIFLNVEFSEIQIFGVKFIIHNKDNLIWILFGWWLYLLWRYFQYHSALQVRTTDQKYFWFVHKLASPYVKRAAKRAYPDCISLDNANYIEVETKSLFVSRFKGKLLFATKNPALNDYREAPFEMPRLWFFMAHVFAFPLVIFHDHSVSDYLLPYAIGGVLIILFLLKVL